MKHVRNLTTIIVFQCLFCLLTTYRCDAQEELSWDILADVTFETEYFEDTDSYWLVPEFGDLIKMYDHQDVIIEGYLIPIDMENDFYVVSRYPYSSCFFCGGAGPESIVEIQLTDQNNALHIDERIRVQGELVLNVSDFEHFNYLIYYARVLE